VNVEPPFVIIATVVELGGGVPSSLFPVPESPGLELLVPVIEGGGFEEISPLFGSRV
jgi:hypothetical protein